MQSLGLSDDRALSAMISVTFDGERALPFDVSSYRSDARARVRLVRTILPILKRIAASDAFRAAYAAHRAQRVAYEPPRTRTRHIEAPGAGERAQAEAERRRHELEAAFPEDPNVLVATRLREFLALTEDMPWRAELVPDGRGHMVFADPTLEARPRDWKLCFRAGRQTVDAARSFVRRWLAELERPRR